MPPSWQRARAAARHGLRALLDLGLPGECAGCRRPAASLCPACRARLSALSFGDPQPWQPFGTSRGGGTLEIRAWGRYEPPARGIVTRWKDHGRHDLDAFLAPLLAESIESSARCLPVGVPILVVPAPSSANARATRGDVPVARLATLAVGLLDRSVRPRVRVAPVVAHHRAVADQLGLGRAERQRNVGFSMWVPHTWRAVVAGTSVIVVDDIVTTGATLRECDRALREAGTQHVLAAVAFAATARGSTADPARAASGKGSM